jgi:dolichyl-phosphate-mannose-protein mannosyltransferase
MIASSGQLEFGPRDPTETHVWRGIRAAFVVYAIACAVRAVVLARSGQDLAACCVTPDSHEYLRLSQGTLFNLARTPGYPVFLWLCQKLFGPSLTSVLWVQVFLTSLTPALVTLFASLAFPRYPAAAYVAGILSAVSLTGLTLSHFLLSEAVFAPLVSAALVTTWVSARTGRTSVMLIAALLGGVAFLVKPVFVAWFILLPLLLVAFAEGEPLRFRAIAAAAVVAAGFPIGWSLVNRVYSGVLTTSSIGVAAGCIYLGGRTEAIVFQPSGPPRQDIRAARARRLAVARGMQATAAYQYYTDCMRRAVLEHPRAAWQAYRESAIEDLPRPFDAGELRLSSGVVQLHPRIRFVMARLSDLLYLLAFVGALRLVIGGRARLVAGLTLLFVAIWIPSALSHGQGARLLYPVESILLLLASVGVVPSTLPFEVRSPHRSVIRLQKGSIRPT